MKLTNRPLSLQVRDQGIRAVASSRLVSHLTLALFAISLLWATNARATPQILVGELTLQGSLQCDGTQDGRWLHDRWEVGFTRLFGPGTARLNVGKSAPRLVRVTGASASPPALVPAPRTGACPMQPQLRSDWIVGRNGVRERRATPLAKGFRTTTVQPWSGLSVSRSGADVVVTVTNDLGAPLPNVEIAMHYLGCMGKPSSQRKAHAAGLLAPGAKATARFPVVLKDGGPYRAVAVTLRSAGPTVLLDVDRALRLEGVRVRCEEARRPVPRTLDAAPAASAPAAAAQNPQGQGAAPAPRVSCSQTEGEAAAPPYVPPAPLVFPPARVVRSIRINRWPEGLWVDGDQAWVSVSGSQQMARIDLKKGRIIRKHRVGRLPTALVATGKGGAFALVQTPSHVFRIRSRGKPTRWATAARNLQEIAWGEGALWGMRWPGGSSATSDVVRFGRRGRVTHRSKNLGRNAFAIAAAHGSVWVAIDKSVEVLNPSTLKRRASVALQSSPRKIATGPDAVFVGGSWHITRVHPRTLATQHVRATSVVVGLHRSSDALVSTDVQGRLTWHQPASLITQRRARLDKGDRITAMADWGKRLVVSVFRRSGDVVLVLE